MEREGHQKGASFIMTYALDSDGELASIENVARGQACNCTCLACGTPLVAKKGEIMIHHFAHEARECSQSFDVYLKKLAIKIISEGGQIYMPEQEWIVSPTISPEGEIEIVPYRNHSKLSSAVFKFEGRNINGAVTDRVPGGLACDLIMNVAGKKETHPLGIVLDTGRARDLKKQWALTEKAREMQHPVLKIDLSEMGGSDADRIKNPVDYILFSAPREFLYSRHEDIIKQKVTEDARIQIGRMASFALNPSPLEKSRMITTNEQVRNLLLSDDVTEYLSFDAEASIALAENPMWGKMFKCSPDAWQRIILSVFFDRVYLYDQPAAVSAKTLLFALRRKNLRGIWRGTFAGHSDLMEEEGTDRTVLWHDAGEKYIRKHVDDSFRRAETILENYFESIVGKEIGDIVIVPTTPGRDGRKRYRVRD